MARDILSGYGPDAPKKQVARITKNGPVDVRDVLNYSPPQGPIGIGNRGPGIGHVEPGYGTEGEESGEETGRPGIGGNRSCGTQGRY